MDEKIRIYNFTGEVRQSSVDKKNRIYVRARMYPGLSISRSIGDVLAHEIGVISKPDIIEHNISNDLFMVIGSGGIWDFITTEEVVELVNGYKDNGSCCDIIYGKVKDTCTNDNSVLDDATIIISYFQ